MFSNTEKKNLIQNYKSRFMQKVFCLHIFEGAMYFLPLQSICNLNSNSIFMTPNSYTKQFLKKKIKVQIQQTYSCIKVHKLL